MVAHGCATAAFTSYSIHSFLIPALLGNNSQQLATKRNNFDQETVARNTNTSFLPENKNHVGTTWSENEWFTALFYLSGLIALFTASKLYASFLSSVSFGS
jgi:hypothetical protein